MPKTEISFAPACRFICCLLRQKGIGFFLYAILSNSSALAQRWQELYEDRPFYHSTVLPGTPSGAVHLQHMSHTPNRTSKVLFSQDNLRAIEQIGKYALEYI